MSRWRQAAAKRRRRAAGPETAPEPAVAASAEASEQVAPAEAAPDPEALAKDRVVWRTRYLQARTALIELQLQERQARLVSAERVRAAVYRAAAEIRDAWLVWPARVAGEVASELGADPRVVEQVLDRLVREHLAELAVPPRLDGLD